MKCPVRDVLVLPVLIVAILHFAAGQGIPEDKSFNNTIINSKHTVTDPVVAENKTEVVEIKADTVETKNVTIDVNNNRAERAIDNENATVTEEQSTTSGPIEYYKTKYDHVDVEAILNNRRMVNFYAKCMLNQAPCPPDGAEFKKILPDAIRTNCLRCTEKQKAVTIRAIKRLMKEYPKVWDQLAKAWDPENIYVAKFLKTYSNWEYKVTTTPKPVVFDRFGDEDDDNNNDKNKKNKKHSTSTTNSGFNIPPLPTIPTKILDRVEPIANGIGASFTATVSIGNRLVNGVIRGIGAVGNRVIQTGAEIADVLVKNLTKPL